MYKLPFKDVSHDLTGQVALVTGAASGLGWHFSRVLAAAGARVAVASRRESNLNELQQLISDEGGECEAFPLDMMDAQAIIDVVSQVEQRLGKVTILVNNAGISGVKMAMKMPLDLVDSVLDTNVRGPFLLACEVARRLKADGVPGRIINLSSISTYRYDGSGSALYSTTKAAIERMTEALAIEWARYNINVNAIAPGFFKSEMTDAAADQLGDISQSFPRKRIGVPSQLDSTLLYLCSPASECVTGAVIVVDDGQTPR